MRRAQLTGAYQSHLVRYRAAAAQVVTEAWDNLDTYDEADIPTLEAAAGPTLAAIRSRASALTSGYLARVTSTPIVAVTADQILLPADWFRQPFMSTWRALSDGLSYTAAVEVGRSRADQTGGDAVTNAARSTAVEVDQSTPSITRWERVPDGNACDWCQEVASQSYASADSADFGHDRCGCDVVPADS